jgi:hypothetical protein
MFYFSSLGRFIAALLEQGKGRPSSTLLQMIAIEGYRVEPVMCCNFSLTCLSGKCLFSLEENDCFKWLIMG